MRHLTIAVQSEYNAVIQSEEKYDEIIKAKLEETRKEELYRNKRRKIY